MDLVKFLSPKHVILVHGEKPKMATLKGRICSELGIPCVDPANNETVCIPSTHCVKAEASHTFIQSTWSPNFKFFESSSESESDSLLKDRKFISPLQVTDERAVEGILVEEKSKKAKIVHQNELLLALGQRKHEVRFAYCWPMKVRNLEQTKATNLPSSSNVFRMVYVKLSDELSGGDIQDFGEHLQVESFQISICLKDRCPYRIIDSTGNESEAVFLCCSWSVADEKLAWKIISILENFQLWNSLSI